MELRLALLAALLQGYRGNDTQTVGHVWPQGHYGLLMPRTGCPEETGWETGSIRMDTKKLANRASMGDHLFGIGFGPTTHIVIHFCVKASDFSREAVKFPQYPVSEVSIFPPGRYCLIRMRTCPAEFIESFHSFESDIAASLSPVVGITWNTSGIMPDKLHQDSGTALVCCRDDGDPHDPISLPTFKPFILLRNRETCPQVVDMDMAEEWVSWGAWNDKKSSLNFSVLGPKGYIALRQNVVLGRLPYCYYTPHVSPESESYSETTFSESASAFIASSKVLFITFAAIAFIACALKVKFTYDKRQLRKKKNSVEVARMEAFSSYRQHQHPSEAHLLQQLSEQPQQQQQRVAGLCSVPNPSPDCRAVCEYSLRVDVSSAARNSITSAWSETGTSPSDPQHVPSRSMLQQSILDDYSLDRDDLSAVEQNLTNDALDTPPTYERMTNAFTHSFVRLPSIVLPRNSGCDSPPSYHGETSLADLNSGVDSELTNLPSYEDSAIFIPSLNRSLVFTGPPASRASEIAAYDLPPAYDDVVN